MNKFSSYLQLAKEQVESGQNPITSDLRKNMLSNSYDSVMLKSMSNGEQGFFITEILNLLIHLTNSCQTRCWHYNFFLG